jgi:hypothetical protein
MRPKALFLRSGVFSFTLIALLLAACLSPTPIVAEESKSMARNNAASKVASHILDGKTFIGPTGEKGKKVHHEDVLRFSDGKFTSSECFQYGFKGGPYFTTIEGDTIFFQAETISPTHGKMVWQGRLKNDTLEVDYTWTKERWFWTTFREYWFKGTLKK